jgi:hypothetical protein
MPRARRPDSLRNVVTVREYGNLVSEARYQKKVTWWEDVEFNALDKDTVGDTRYAAIEAALQNGVSYEELRDRIREQTAARIERQNNNPDPGREAWDNRDSRIPESLYWY